MYICKLGETGKKWPLGIFGILLAECLGSSFIYLFLNYHNHHHMIVDIFNEREDFMWKLFGIKQVVDPSEDE